MKPVCDKHKKLQKHLSVIKRMRQSNEHWPDISTPITATLLLCWFASFRRGKSIFLSEKTRKRILTNRLVRFDSYASVPRQGAWLECGAAELSRATGTCRTPLEVGEWEPRFWRMILSRVSRIWKKYFELLESRQFFYPWLEIASGL